MSGNHILILGTGSVGRRHAHNFHALGCEISCMDPRGDRLGEAAAETPLRYQFHDLGAALRHGKDFAGVVVCSPPKFHAEQTIAALEAGLPVLLEKPPTPDTDGCRRIHERLTSGKKLLLGYTYRWWPPVKQLKSLIAAGTIGTLRHARFTMSAHLADWHPWERYQDFFMASRDLGGGALLDESHFIDLMIWFFGMPERLFARVEKISDLDIATDDLVDISAAYGDHFRVTIHLDLFGRPHEKGITVTGEKGTLQCLFDPDQVRIGHEAEAKWQTESFSLNRNDMFIGVAREFLELVKDRCRNPTCTIADGLNVLQALDACRKSQQLGREIVLAVP